MRDLGTIAVTAQASRDAGKVELQIDLDIPAGSHIEAHVPSEPFLIPTVVDFEGIDVESVTYPEPVEKDLGIPGSRLLVYEGRVRITARARADQSLRTASGTIRFQPCVGGACLPPRRQSWQTPIREVGRTPSAGAATRGAWRRASRELSRVRLGQHS